jgi:hypothetical protein
MTLDENECEAFIFIKVELIPQRNIILVLDQVEHKLRRERSLMQDPEFYSQGLPR